MIAIATLLALAAFVAIGLVVTAPSMSGRF